MSVELNTAKHICKVVSKQIKSGFPELTIEYILHKENERAQTLDKNLPNIKKHVAGKTLLESPSLADKQKILEKNKSRFTVIAKHEKNGILGLFKSRAFIGISFINYDRFRSASDLRNHALHLAWHAIELYLDAIRTKKDDDDIISFIEDKNLFIPHLDEAQRAYRNLISDIFSATVQRLQGRKNAFEHVVTQRIYDTLTPQPDFEAEIFPSPICADTFDFAFNNCEKNNRHESDLFVKAANITRDISAAFDINTIEQWRNFALPAQYMAWTGSSPETILGAALYTAENIHTQSISDMIAERMDLRAELLSVIDAYNPFAHPETNLKIHKKKCTKLKDNIFFKIQNQSNIGLLLDEATKQNQKLFDNDLSGWCADILIKTYHHFKSDLRIKTFYESRRSAIALMDDEIKKSDFQTLATLSDLMFKKIRKGYALDKNTIINLAQKLDDAKYIVDTVERLDELETTLPQTLFPDEETGENLKSKTSELNISKILGEQPA